MAKQGETITQPGKGRRLVLFPLPFQGHINPMLQLADILYSKGFSITITHTHFSSPNKSNYPHFTFQPIPQHLMDSKASAGDIYDVQYIVTVFNNSYVEPFRDCLAQLLSEEPIACLITDAHWYFTQAVADSLKIPRLVLRTSSLSCFLLFDALLLLREKGYLHNQDYESDAPVPELPPIKVKDIPKIITRNAEDLCELLGCMIKETKLASGLIWNSFEELEQPALAKFPNYFPIPHFPIGPFHKYFPASSSSLLTQDQSCIPWLDTQAPNSVVYVSFGSIAELDVTGFSEMAWGLANSMQPFLWVVRPGLIPGSEWLEHLPNGFLETVGGRGHIVKWSPQQQVLAHPATGGFWTHTGWNSTLESICEGVPMICSPSFGDQPVNARYICDVWKIGVHLEYELERGEIVSAIKRLMVDKEGEEMRERILRLKDDVNCCLEQGGSSYQSLESLVNQILSF